MRTFLMGFVLLFSLVVLSGCRLVGNFENDNSHFSAIETTNYSWGSTGSDVGQFDEPSGVAVDFLGCVYVSDENNHRIPKFIPTGVFVAQWGVAGSGDGQFDEPSGVAVDFAGSVYVADEGNHRIQKFTSSGVLVGKWGSGGCGNWQFNSPNGVAVDSAGKVYVADSENHRIQKFTP